MSLANQVVENFNNALGTAISRGMIVRGTTGVRQTLLAQADTLPHLASVLGVANNGTGPAGLYFAVCAGEVEVLLETGLTPVGAQPVYVSASVAGRGTTAAPTLAVQIGTITDASQYANTGRVTVSLLPFLAGGTGPDPLQDPSLVRYYFLDNELGNDANIGYIDAAALTVFTPTQTSPVALKTSEELRKRVPRSGASRVTVVLLKPRSDAGNYVNKAGANDYLDINYDGYRAFYFRGSDLTNSTNDQVDLGGVVGVAGPNADGSWTATGTAGFTITNAAGVLPAENSTTGTKFQFKGNVTAALRTVGNMCLARLGATTLDVANNSNVPANLDEYFLMYPGVKFTTIVGPSGRTNTQNTRPRGVTLAGLRFTATTQIACAIPPVPVFLKFDGVASLIFQERGVFTTTYTAEDLSTNRTVNHSIEITGNNSTVTGVDLFGLLVVFHGAAFSQAQTFGGLYCNGLLTIQSTPGPVSIANNSQIIYGSGGSNIRPARLIAGATMNGVLRIDGIDLSGSSVGLTVTGRSDISFFNVTGNPTAAPVIDASACLHSRFVIDSTVTSTKATDILLGNSVTATFASLGTSSQSDDSGNIVSGGAGVPVKKTVLKFSGVYIGGAGSVTNYMGDGGTAAAVVNTAVVNYPMPPCRVRNLRIQASANPLAGNLVARVLKNGAATGITATITAGSTARFSDLTATHEAQFNGTTDVMDIDLTETGVGTAVLSATLECF